MRKTVEKSVEKAVEVQFCRAKIASHSTEGAVLK